MAATPSIKIVKSMPWRGGTRTWANRYHFNGGTPADSAHWTTLSDAVVTAEKASLGPGNTIVQAVGYAAGSDVPIFTKTYSTAGTFVATGGTLCPGEVAALIRYATLARTPKNHPVYLFNYVHGAYIPSTGGGDALLAIWVTVLQTYATAWISGFSDGTNTLVRAGPNGATATARVVETYATHRDFPRG